MSLGKIVSGSPNVLIGGAKAARKSDLIDHGGLLTSGCATVVINGELPAARVGDALECPMDDGKKHGEGIVLPPGCTSVLVGGRQAARVGDATLCLGVSDEDEARGGGGGGSDAAKVESPCAKLWNDYQNEARDMTQIAGDDHRWRNKIISGAYANLCRRNPDFQWAGLAAYASKQVGCAMDHAIAMRNLGGLVAGTPPALSGVPGPAGLGVAATAEYTYVQLGKGNRDLFLDIYPMHRFFEEHGFIKMAQCAGERRPPIPAQALDGFRALHRYKQTGETRYLNQSVGSLAFHEQVNILQTLIYNKSAFQKILRVNETGLPGSSPADVVMNSGCSDPTGGKQTHTFGDKGRTKLYDVQERMDWILNDIARDYATFAGSKRHKDDLDAIERQGEIAGAQYPGPRRR